MSPTSGPSARGGGGSQTAGGSNSPNTCGSSKPSSQYKGADGTSPTVCNGGGGECSFLIQSLLLVVLIILGINYMYSCM